MCIYFRNWRYGQCKNNLHIGRNQILLWIPKRLGPTHNTQKKWFCFYTPGTDMHPGWSSHKWTALCVDVNAPQTFRGQQDSPHRHQSEVIWATYGHILFWVCTFVPGPCSTEVFCKTRRRISNNGQNRSSYTINGPPVSIWFTVMHILCLCSLTCHNKKPIVHLNWFHHWTSNQKIPRLP